MQDCWIERLNHMKLRELVNKIDNDIVLWIVRDEDNKTVFRKERTYTSQACE